MKYQSQGIILVTTLLFISLLSLMVLSAMQLVALQVKAVGQLAQANKTAQSLETIAIMIANKKFNKACLMKDKTSKLICPITYKGQRYYYHVEEIGAYPCLQRHHLGTLHYRISVFSSENQERGVQIRVAKVQKGLICVNQPIKTIPKGILSYRTR